MRTLATCRRTDRRCPTAGFTILELVVVLALLAMAVALVGPPLQRTYQSLVTSGEHASVVQALESLPLMARTEGRPLVFERGDATAVSAYLSLPQGWSVNPLSDITVAASGICSAAQVEIRGPAGTSPAALTRPHCKVSDER